jgi:hypothetical protein
MPFEGPVVVREAEGAEASEWELLEPLAYLGRTDRFVVPQGFVTDFASVPRPLTWLIPRYGRYTKAAILHDWLCRRCAAGEFSWVDADGIFRRVLHEQGVPLLRRWTMWTAVRLHSIVRGDPRTLWTQGAGDAIRLVLLTIASAVFLVVPFLVVTLWLGLAWLAEAIAWLPARITAKGEKVNRPRATLPR